MANTGNTQVREMLFDGDADTLTSHKRHDRTIYWTAKAESVQVVAAQYNKAIAIIRNEAVEAVHRFYENAAQGDGSAGSVYIVQMDGLAHNSQYPSLYCDVAFSSAQEPLAQDYMYILDGGRCNLTLARLEIGGTYQDIFDPDATYAL